MTRFHLRKPRLIPATFHRRLHIASPDRDRSDPSPDLSALERLSVPFLGTEVSRNRKGEVEFRLLARDDASFERVSDALAVSFPHVSVGEEVDCPMPYGPDGWRLAFARPNLPSHVSPLNILRGPSTHAPDHTGQLVSVLESPSLGESIVHVQVLARNVGAWEDHPLIDHHGKVIRRLQGYHDSFWGETTRTEPSPLDREYELAIEKRRAEPAWHLELRVAWLEEPGDEPDEKLAVPVLKELQHWLDQWRSMRSGSVTRTWRQVGKWPVIGAPRAELFTVALHAHEPDLMPSPRHKRDVAASEMVTFVAPPWQTTHALLAQGERATEEVPAMVPLGARSVVPSEVPRAVENFSLPPSDLRSSGFPDFTRTRSVELQNTVSRRGFASTDGRVGRIRPLQRGEPVYERRGAKERDVPEEPSTSGSPQEPK